MKVNSKVITLAARPVGFPKDSDFKLETREIGPASDGEVLVRTRYLSVDPYMRGRMNDVKGYAEPVRIGGAMGGGGVGVVLESKSPQFSEGNEVVGNWAWREYAVMKAQELQKVDTSLAPLSAYLGILGMPGMTAYFGFLDICKPKEGDTVFVSGAAGAVGAIVGQIAKIKGCRVVGSAGTDEKVAYLTEKCGYDAAFNYKTSDNFVRSLSELCPDRIDCYFDNVGGKMTDAVLMNLNDFARISICGAISQYNLEKPEMGPRLLTMLLVHQSSIEGFLVFRYLDRYPEGMKQMAEWLQQGKLKFREDIVEGLENTPEAFMRMLRGENKGKQVVKVWES